MGCLSSTKKEKVVQPRTEIIEFPDPMKGYRGELAEAAKGPAQERLALAGKTYQGPLQAALSEFEEKGLADLAGYLQSPMGTEGELYTSAEDEILKTLQGEAYDPAEGPYYQAYRDQMMRELGEAKDRLAARASAGDKFFGGGRISTEGEMEESALGQLAVTLGGMTERERERRLGAVPRALELTRYGEEAPVSRVAAATQIGQLPRLIEQAEMDAEYQEWIRALNDMNIALDTATGLATYQPRAAVVGYDPYMTGGGQQDWVQGAEMAIAVKAMMVCVPEGTVIDTIIGQKKVEDIRAGDRVYDKDGNEAKVLMKYEFDETPTERRFIEMTFADGTKLVTCDLHKIDGIRTQDLEVGERNLIAKRFVRNDNRTYDLLTTGRDGSYRSNGIGIDSMIPELQYLTQKAQEVST